MSGELSTADVLRGAKQVLIERGWAKRKVVDRNGCVCAVGAINVIVTGHPHARGARPRSWLPAVRAFERAVGDRFIGEFNDDQRSVEPVLAAFDAAIALAESEAS